MTLLTETQPRTSTFRSDFPAGEGMIRYAPVGDLLLESGKILPEVTLAFETWGTLNSDASNAVLILHALTGDTHVARGNAPEGANSEQREHAQSEGWWDDLVGPGKVIDTERYFVLCPNIIGGCTGSTGPVSPAPASVDPTQQPWGSRFPLVTIRDSVHAEAALADQLGIDSFYAVIGGSLGGARALEWALTYPERVERCCVIASAPSATADHIAWAQSQNLAIQMDPHFVGGDYYGGETPSAGLGLARRIAHTTYRSAPELHFRFGRDYQADENPLEANPADRGGRYAIESYLDYHAQKLTNRFDANSYLAINNALMSHDVTRDRGTLRQALAASTCSWSIAYVDSDRLFYPCESIVLAASLPQPVEAQEIRSVCGHDGFLIESDQLAQVIDAALAQERRTRGASAA